MKLHPLAVLLFAGLMTASCAPAPTSTPSIADVSSPTPTTSPTPYGFWPAKSPRATETAQPKSTTPEPTAEPFAQQLATLDNSGSAEKIRALLKKLARETGDSQGDIADRTARCTLVLKQDYGKVVTNQRFLEEAQAYFDGRGPKTNYRDLSGMLVIGLSK